MKLLLDECLDWRLLRELPEHEIRTTRQMGWIGRTNGALLAAAENEFDVFITVDNNLAYQQNTTRFAIAVVVLRPRSLRLHDVLELVPKLRATLETIGQRDVTFVE
jgi:predicted nuclease of predicted toxin-antitoxin system